jgi:DNA-binding PadR family transcriptional regulator
VNARLFVLGMLAREPMHGYQIRKALAESRTDTWAEVLPGSIYHALAAMEREGLVAVQQVESIGERSRSIYRITRTGRGALRRLAKAAWAGPPNPFPTRLYSAISFMSILSRAERVAALASAQERIEVEIADWGRAIEVKSATLAPSAMLAMQNATAHLQLDRELLMRLQESHTDCGGGN